MKRGGLTKTGGSAHTVALLRVYKRESQMRLAPDQICVVHFKDALLPDLLPGNNITLVQDYNLPLVLEIVLITLHVRTNVNCI
jgi:hypothetical protein